MIYLIKILLSFLLMAEVTADEPYKPPEEPPQLESLVSVETKKELSEKNFYPLKQNMDFDICPGKELGFAKVIPRLPAAIQVVSKSEPKKVVGANGQTYILGMIDHGVADMFSFVNTDSSKKMKQRKFNEISVEACDFDEKVSSHRNNTKMESNITIKESCPGKPTVIRQKSINLYKSNNVWFLELEFKPAKNGKNVSCRYSTNKV